MSFWQKWSFFYSYSMEVSFIDDQPGLTQEMTCRRLGKPLAEPIMTFFADPQIYVSPFLNILNCDHDDVIKGSIFRVTGPLCGEFTGHRWIPRTKASDAELWCFLLSSHEQTAKQTIELPVICDATALIMMSILRIWQQAHWSRISVHSGWITVVELLIFSWWTGSISW